MIPRRTSQDDVSGVADPADPITRPRERHGRELEMGTHVEERSDRERSAADGDDERLERPAEPRGEHGRHASRAGGSARDGRPSRASRVPHWLRALLPAVLVIAWLAAASVGGPYFGRVSEVSSNDATTYLPASADATAVQSRLGEFSDSDALPAVVVFSAERELTPSDLTALAAAIERISAVPGVEAGVSPPVPSADGRAAQVFAPIDRDADLRDAVDAVREAASSGAPDGVSAHVTGPAGFTTDLLEAFSGIDGVLLLVALGAVLVILLIVYRSPLLPVLVLSTSMFALCTALLTVWWLAKAEVLVLTGQTQGILFILVIGAATDYSLLYVARFREALREHETRWDATAAALRSSLEPILASGGTVAAGLLCLLLSDLGSNRSLGPVAAIGIGFAVLASLTLLPSLLLATGRAAFWPRRTAFDPSRTADDEAVPSRGAWAALGRLVAARPRVVWVVTAIVLGVAAVGVLGLRADGVAQRELVLTASDARDGQIALEEHFPGGSGSPALVIAPAAELDAVAETLLAVPGVESLAVAAKDSPTGSLPLTVDGVQAPPSFGAGGAGGVGAPGAPASASAEPTIAGGDVLIRATLADAADSDAAKETVRAMRAELPETARVGGVTATAIDTDDASIHDRTLIIPVVLAVILAILALLLRSIVAPVMLVLTVVLSFGASMGVAALVFDGLLGFPGADPAVPLYGFVFLVALGIDYNIFLMTRVREETLVHGSHQGVLRGLALTGGVITSAGVVLAATFAALGVIPILFLAQIAFIVAFGVLLDTIVVRSLLVPALAYDLGPRLWWPSRLSRA